MALIGRLEQIEIIAGTFRENLLQFNNVNSTCNMHKDEMAITSLQVHM